MTTVGLGSVSIEDCVCVPGLYGNLSVGCFECIGMEYCPVNSMVPIECPEGYGCSTSLATPMAGNWVNGTFERCPEGYFCSNSSSAPSECGVGMLCEIGSLEPIPCPGGKWCPGNTTSVPLECPAGSYCRVGSSEPLTCPVAKYCPNGSAAGIICDPGYVCPPGSVNQTACAAGFVCEMGTGNMTICPANFFCPAMSTHPISCPNGSYCSEGTLAFPTQCAAGFYGASPWCEPCLDLMESSDKATTCVCKQGLFFVFDNVSGTGNSVLENGRCLNTSVFCPRNSYCRRDGVSLPCPVGSKSNGGISDIANCVCNNGGVVIGGQCVNGTAAPSVAAALPVVVIAGAAAGGVVAMGGAGLFVAWYAGLIGGGSSAMAAGGGAAATAVGGGGAAAVVPGVVGVEYDSVLVSRQYSFIGVPAFLQEIRIDLHRKTV